MSTRAFASAVVPASIDKVWAVLRLFTSPSTLFSTVQKVEIEEGASATTVGAVRKITFKNGVVQRQRLLELSDLHFTAGWEVLPNENAEVSSAVSAVITTIQLYRVTENHSTYVSWSADFSADATGQYVVQEQQDYAKNLADIKAHFSK